MRTAHLCFHTLGMCVYSVGDVAVWCKPAQSPWSGGQAEAGERDPSPIVQKCCC